MSQQLANDSNGLDIFHFNDLLEITSRWSALPPASSSIAWLPTFRAPERVVPAHITNLHQQTSEAMLRVLEKLQGSCEFSERLALEIDQALSERDLVRFNHLYQEQMEEKSRLEDYILHYIECYLASRPVGDISRFRIRFTDSRALFGAQKVHAWINRGPYLSHLARLTATAARLFPNEALVTRTFIIPSFSELKLDSALYIVLKEVLVQHLQALIPVSLVSIRLLDDLGFDSVNFCTFEGGHLMKLDLGSTGTLQIYDERIADRFNQLHDEIHEQKIQRPGSVSFTNINELVEHFDMRIAEQVTAEGAGSGQIVTPAPSTSAAVQYSEQVARWWSDPAWDEERKRVEENFLHDWILHYVGMRRANILDAACGTGMHAFMLAQWGHRVTACDASWHQIERARWTAKRKHRSNHRLEPQNPFFRTLAWREIDQHYHGRFDALLCLGGSLIHASPEELPAVAAAFCRAVGRSGHILIDHREIEFFRDAQNRQARHAGHSRKVEVDFSINHIQFHMTDNLGATRVIEGTVHPIAAVCEAFHKAGARLISNFHDHQLAHSQDVPEWHHLTFCVE